MALTAVGVAYGRVGVQQLSRRAVGATKIRGARCTVFIKGGVCKISGATVTGGGA